MRIKEESIQEVLERADIVSVVEGYVKLRRSGRNYVALCPFHKEKTPSFTVSREKGLFHCFGCGVGGNVVSFLMKLENLTFVDAIETLAKRFGIKLQYEAGYHPEEDQELEKLYEYSLITAQYFHNNLLETNEGNQALKYLKDRGIEESTIKSFMLGYALSAWDGLLNFIQKKNYDLEIFEKLGLIIKKDTGGYYDRFRGRIMFPIFSPIGKVIAFGGRILEHESDQPKYLNSPESRIYVKGKNLYGLFHTKDEIRKKDSVILVEGYMDFLTLYQNGIKNVVASAGTSLTIEQIFILSKVTQNINLIFDGDEAGQRAAVRSIELMLQTDTNFKIVSLPENDDPDSFVRNKGKDKFVELINEGKNYIDFVYQLALKKNSLNDTQSKLKVIDSLIQFTSKIRDEVKRDLYAQEIAKKFNVTKSSVIQKLNRYVKNLDNVQNKEISYQQENKTSNIDLKQIETVPLLEKGIIKLICEVDYNYLEVIFDHINANDFIHPLASEIFSVLKNEYLNLKSNEKIDGALIFNKLEKEELKSILSDALVERYVVSDGWQEVEEINISEVNMEKTIADYIKKIKLNSLNKKLDDLHSKKSDLIDFDELEKVFQQINELIKKKSFYQNFTLKLE